MPCNRIAFDVFSRCTWQRILAGDRIIATSIAGPEIESVMNMRNVPPEQRPETLDLVRHAERSVQSLINQR